MIETLRKQKLPQENSYPIGAEAISSALDGVPQYSQLSLIFVYRDQFWASEYSDKLKTGGDIEIVRVQCTAPFYTWEIFIRSVPRELKPKAEQTIKSKVLPALRQSLLSAVDVGPKSGTFFFRAEFSTGTGSVQIFS